MSDHTLHIPGGCIVANHEPGSIKLAFGIKIGPEPPVIGVSFVWTRTAKLPLAILTVAALTLVTLLL